MTAHAARRYRESDRKLHDENMKLTSEYRRITEQFKDLQSKFRHFELTDTRKFEEVQLRHSLLVGLECTVV